MPYLSKILEKNITNSFWVKGKLMVKVKSRTGKKISTCETEQWISKIRLISCHMSFLSILFLSIFTKQKSKICTGKNIMKILNYKTKILQSVVSNPLACLIALTNCHSDGLEDHCN